ncbi:hypothetical protein OB905_01185 [Halobacteria archaeon AArc-dxtr1]|nr:hypothetical protein [Halobacteria archaeon AArc-dxtr1]
MTMARFENGQRVIDRWDEVFRALSAEPRRQLVVSLLDRPDGDPAPLPECAVNPNVPIDAEQLRQELYHRHLPLLAEMKFVEWRDDPFEAVRGSRFDEVAVVFRSLYADAVELPDSLVVGCQRLERERQHDDRKHGHRQQGDHEVTAEED